MVRQKTKQTFENLYTCVPPPGPLAATMRFDENLFQNSKTKNGKINEKTDICIHNTFKGRKKSKGRNPIEKKDEKTLINEETVLARPKNAEELDPKENEKDEDTEEFFVMIKETVKRAVEKSLQEMIAPSLREINIKLDENRERIRTNENALEKIHAELISKIIHYGEENSRHFRYLCMKSEYDKMFYQHQNVITAVPVDARQNVINPYPQHLTPPSEPLAQKTHQTKPKANKTSILPMGCNCHNNDLTDFNCIQRSKLSVSSKSSDMGIREVKDLLEQLQKFYDQHNQEKYDQKEELENEPLKVPDQDDSADGDEDDDESSDDMTSPSIEENIGAGGDS